MQVSICTFHTTHETDGPFQITTVFQEPDPARRDAVYRAYLACASPEAQETDASGVTLF